MSDDVLMALGETAKTRLDFVRFLEAFSADYRDNPDEWENGNLSDFLEALAAWSEDCTGFYQNVNLPIDADQPQWRVFADMLLAARVYE